MLTTCLKKNSKPVCGLPTQMLSWERNQGWSLSTGGVKEVKCTKEKIRADITQHLAVV